MLGSTPRKQQSQRSSSTTLSTTKLTSRQQSLEQDDDDNDRNALTSTYKGPAVPPPQPVDTTTAGNRTAGACLRVTVLSVYDLVLTEAPISISMSCMDKTVATGSPSARHKDRNSFRFLETSASTMTVHGSLEDLYKAEAVLSVNYGQRKAAYNIATAVPLKLNTLRINESTWLVLNLEQTNYNNKTDKTVNNDNDDTDEEIPTLRLHVRLEGPYRPEIAATLSLANGWFHVADYTEQQLTTVMTHVNTMAGNLNFLLIPTVPLLTTAAVLSPVLIGALVVLVPVFLPALVVLLLLALAGSGVVGILYASTSTGRDHIGGMVAPLVQTLLSTPSGQRLVYQTGPRPTPVSVARAISPKDRMGKLWMSLWMDLMGSASYLLPVVGEAFDIVWAPVQTVFIMAMYDPVAPSLKYVSFLEEILPFTDVVPSATIGWIAEYGPGLLQLTDGSSGGGGAHRELAALLSTGSKKRKV